MFPQQRMVGEGRTLVIREATAQDAAALVAHAHAMAEESDFTTFGPGEFELGEAEEVAFLASCQATDNHIYLVAELDGEIVGSAHFAGGRRKRVRHTGEFGMGVRRAHWGVGIGGALLDALLAWARANEAITRVNLRVRTDNRVAIRLYERAGFRLEGTIGREMRIGRLYFDHHCMGLDV